MKSNMSKNRMFIIIAAAKGPRETEDASCLQVVEEKMEDSGTRDLDT